MNQPHSDSLEQVLKKGHGMGVIEDFLCTWNDAGSTSSWNSNYSAGTVASMQSTRSVRSAGGRSVKSFKSVRSAVNFNTYRQKTNQTQRGAAGNIDQMLQCMLGPSDESTSHPVAMGTMTSLDEEDEKNENPKYKEYQHLYRIVRDRVCNAKVMSFGGETKIYRPFKWMNDQIEKQKAAQLLSQKTKEEKTKEDDVSSNGNNNDGDDVNDCDSKEDDHGIVRYDDNVPSNAYRLLGVGVLSTFLPSAILGGHCIDTTPLIDSNDLAEAMEKTLDLRIKICNILQNAFGTQTSISLQRWFQPNRDGQMNYDPQWTSQWVVMYKKALKVLFVDIGRGVDAKASIALVTPLQMLAHKKKKNSKRSKKTKKGGDSGMCALTASGLPAVRHISQLLAAAYLGTLLTLKHLDGDCKLKGLAMALSKVSKFEFETVMAIDMLQNGDLSASCYTLIDENQKEFRIDGPNAVVIDPLHPPKKMSPIEMKNDRSLRILTRCCCLLPMRPFTDGKKPWESQLSHSLAAFNHVSTAYYHGLKYGIESCITWLYCKIQEDATASDVDVDAEETKESEPTPLQRAKRSNAIITSPSFLKELALSLKQLPPEPCTGMGVLIRRFVHEFAKLEWNEKVSKLSDEKKEEVISSQMTILQASFPAFTRHRFAVQCCVQFFYQICTLVKQLGDAEVLKDRTVIQFEDAYEYLRELGIWDAVYFMELQQTKLKKKKVSSKKSGKTTPKEER